MSAKTLVVDIVKSFWIMLKTVPQMHLKLLHKEQFRKQQKQLVIWLVIKLQMTLQGLCHEVTQQKQLVIWLVIKLQIKLQGPVHEVIQRLLYKQMKNGGNVPNLEITEVMLVHCNTVNSSYQQNSNICSK